MMHLMLNGLFFSWPLIVVRVAGNFSFVSVFNFLRECNVSHFEVSFPSHYCITISINERRRVLGGIVMAL